MAACLARFKGQSRIHTESDLRGYLNWCESRDLDPLAATRPHVEFYVRWLQEVRRYRPSTVSRRTSVVAGFYRTCVIDAVLEHSPAEYVRRPNVPAESPTLGLTHLQFEAMLTTATHDEPLRLRSRHHARCSGKHSSPRCLMPESTCAMCRSPPVTPTRAPPCVTTGLARTWTGGDGQLLFAPVGLRYLGVSAVNACLAGDAHGDRLSASSPGPPASRSVKLVLVQ